MLSTVLSATRCYEVRRLVGYTTRRNAKFNSSDVINWDYRSKLHPVSNATYNNITTSIIPLSGMFSADRLLPVGFLQGIPYLEITLPSANTPLTRIKQTTQTTYSEIKLLTVVGSSSVTYSLTDVSNLLVGMTAVDTGGSVTDAVIASIDVGKKQVTLDKTLSGTPAIGVVVTFTFPTASGGTVLYFDSVAGLKEGQLVAHANVAVDSYISTVSSANNSVTLSAVTTGIVAAGQTITFGAAKTVQHDWTITNVELVMPILRMGSDFSQSFRSLLISGVPLSYNINSWTNVQQTIAQSSSGANTLTYSTRRRSVKALFNIFRKNEDLTSAVVDSCSARRTLGCSSYNVEIGGVRTPSKDIAISDTDLGHVYAFLQGAMSNIGNTSSSTSINLANFRQADANDNTVASKIAYALELDTYGHSATTSGRNLSHQGQPLVINVNLGSDAGCAQMNKPVLSDLYLMTDAIVTIDGISGTISVAA